MSMAAGSLLTISPSHLLTKTIGKKATQNKIIVLGFDGIDPHLLQVWMEEGKLPAFQHLWKSGGFKALRTSCPPQSPVAWSNFITGMNPGGHGIYDFIHRNPENYIPIFSGSKTSEAGKKLSINGFEFPLSSGEVELCRKGRAFWQILEDYDIPSTVFKIPSNYPPAPTKQRTLSGMGTPDILGTYGICNFYTTESAQTDPDIGGARVHEVYVIGNQVHAKIPGPANPFKKDHPDSYVDFQVYIDPENPVAKIKVQDQEFILKEGKAGKVFDKNDLPIGARLHFKIFKNRVGPPWREGIIEFYFNEDGEPSIDYYSGYLNYLVDRGAIKTGKGRVMIGDDSYRSRKVSGKYYQSEFVEKMLDEHPELKEV